MVSVEDKVYTKLSKEDIDSFVSYFKTLIDKYQLPLYTDDVIEDDMSSACYIILRPTQTIVGRNMHKERVKKFSFVEVVCRKSILSGNYNCNILLSSIVKPYKSRCEDDMYIMGCCQVVDKPNFINYDWYFNQLKEKLTIISKN